MPRDEREKAEETLRKRRAAEKGLKPQSGDRPADPMERGLPEEGQPDGEAIEKAAIAGIVLRRSG